MRHEEYGEALAREASRPAIDPRYHESGAPTLLSEEEGHMCMTIIASHVSRSARSSILSMLGSQLYESKEISPASGRDKPGGAGKVTYQRPAVYADEKPNNSVVPAHLSNNGFFSADNGGKGVVKGSCEQPSASSRTQSRTSASSGLLVVRQAARRDRRVKFTSLLNHVVEILHE